MNETELATACSLLKLGNRYIQFTTPFSILSQVLKNSHNKKLKTKTLFLISVIFSLISTSQSRVLAPIWVYPQPSEFYSAVLQGYTLGWGRGGCLECFCPWPPLSTFLNQNSSLSCFLEYWVPLFYHHGLSPLSVG